VQIGTAYLTTPQSTISAIHRAALRAAQDDSTRLTNLFTGRPARGILNRFVREHGPMNEFAPQFPLATGAVAPLRAHHETQGSGEYSPLWAGQAAALAREEDAGELTGRLWREAKAALSAVRLSP
jgi:nitronate monooxygenase